MQPDTFDPSTGTPATDGTDAVPVAPGQVATDGTAPAPQAAPAASPVTRRSLTAARRASGRRRSLTVGAVAAAALLVGSGFAVSTTTGGSTATAASDVAAAQQEQSERVAEQLREAQARSTISIAQQVISSTEGKVDASALKTSVASLADYEQLDGDALDQLLAETVTASQSVQAAAGEADRQAAAAAAKAAADKAAAEKAAAEKAAAEKAAAEKAAAEKKAADAAAAQAGSNTPEGAQASARRIASEQYGWGEDQMSCLVNLWQKESGWNYQALNASSGAAGIPQSLPGSKMATVAPDWATNATTQVTWGLQYIDRAYGTPCAAWGHSQAVNWY